MNQPIAAIAKGSLIMSHSQSRWVAILGAAALFLAGMAWSGL
jgi:hypothetical protein